ncbi:hypothetical protein CC2G_002462 [Coprinopsis cinerea AmutBmut pab1-1]|nr:hypothetical protein CC2G_002462 [Coprinopsis cinerea AmutBmut pab1-1]
MAYNEPKYPGGFVSPEEYYRLYPDAPGAHPPQPYVYLQTSPLKPNLTLSSGLAPAPSHDKTPNTATASSRNPVKKRTPALRVRGTSSTSRILMIFALIIA